jgi:hypothetical protein
MAQVGDAPGIRALLDRQGLEPEELAVARLVRFDPRTDVVICATALIGSSETIVGVGEIGVGPEATISPKQLYVDEQLTDGLDTLLTRALIGRAGAIARSPAA